MRTWAPLKAAGTVRDRACRGLRYDLRRHLCRRSLGHSFRYDRLAADLEHADQIGQLGGLGLQGFRRRGRFLDHARILGS